MPTTATPLPDGSVLAALDLGSNSFHLIVARLEHGEIRPIHTLAEKVQLAAGLIGRQLSEEAVARGLACLERFDQLLQTIEPSRIRVVGTHALRRAKNRRAFTEPASRILGVPIDVVYGREEARLVYLGVAHSLADDEASRLVVDIGGGSTEFIVGQRFEPTRMESLQLGCVSYSQAFFPEGEISKKGFNAAYEQARVEVSHIRRAYNARHWQEAVGSSGTFQAIETLIALEGWRDNGIDNASLEKLRKRLLKHDHADDINYEGLSDKRRRVIMAGIAIAMAVFKELDIKEMRTSTGALREGLIYDLVGRLQHEDVRERSISALVARYSSDLSEAEMVAESTAWLTGCVADAWQLSDTDIELLHWAGRCHAIGTSISAKHYNRHSGYLLENCDLPGFSQGEQELLGTLVRGQRGKITESHMEAIPETARDKANKMLVLLRLAVVFKWVERFEDLKDCDVAASSKELRLAFPQDWYEQHPLTTSELRSAGPSIGKLGIDLVLD
ncbi:MAG: Ppx/GppA phosphatase family protein [Luminiphilus sp.]